MFFGFAIGVIGTDPLDGVNRYVFTDSLLSGVEFIPALIGLFALSGVFVMVEEADHAVDPLKDMPTVIGQFGLIKPHFWTLLRSTLVGYLVSVVPGHGATISAVVSYAVQKRLSRHPETFGKATLRASSLPRPAPMLPCRPRLLRCCLWASPAPPAPPF